VAGSGFVGEKLPVVSAVSVSTECYKDIAPIAQLLTLRNVAGQARHWSASTTTMFGFASFASSANGASFFASAVYSSLSELAKHSGSSVLTVTSLGMAERSVDLKNPEAPRSRDVALWKDGVKGAQTIPLPGKAQGIILRLQVEYREEFCADGRGDHQTTSYAVLEKEPIPVLVNHSN